MTNATVPPPPSPPVRPEPTFLRPLENAWQRKWLALEVTHERLVKLATEAMFFCQRWVQQSPEGRLLYIHGISGNGKTHVGEAIARYCRMSSHYALRAMPAHRTTMPSTGSYRWPELANDFRNKNESVLPDLFEADCLFLDDVGAEDDPWKVVLDKFYQVLSRRENKFTVITSNIAPPDWATQEPRITDRLLRNSVIVDLKGVPSYAEWLRLHSRAA